jgi:hypothetical protein
MLLIQICVHILNIKNYFIISLKTEHNGHWEKDYYFQNDLQINLFIADLNQISYFQYLLFPLNQPVIL